MVLATPYSPSRRLPLDALAGEGLGGSMRVDRWTTILVATGLFGCGGSTPAPDEPESGESATPTAEGSDPGDKPAAGGDAAKAEEPSGIPTACADPSSEYCTPGKRFTKRLCEGDFPTVALAMFASSSPWKKAYLGRKTKAWSATGAGSSNEEIPRDEEVVVLLQRGPADLGGMQVSGASGGFEVLRWNGNCVTLQEGELLFDAPPRPKIARIVWKRIEMDTRDTLREDETINKAYIQHRKHCKGVSMGDVSLECVKADKKLGQVIADFVRDGGNIGTANRLP